MPYIDSLFIYITTTSKTYVVAPKVNLDITEETAFWSFWGISEDQPDHQNHLLAVIIHQVFVLEWDQET